jgi:hypothetical protein
MGKKVKVAVNVLIDGGEGFFSQGFVSLSPFFPCKKKLRDGP